MKISITTSTYNHEKYIKDAVVGNLNQRYEPLEIIFSDDASSDKTYSLMNDIIESYLGTHKIILRKNKINLGVSSHKNLTFNLSKGDVVIGSAGDDISLPERSLKVAECFLNSSDVVAVEVGYYEIDEEGNIFNTVDKPKRAETDPVKYILKSDYVVGAAMAYKRVVFESFPAMHKNVIYEDRVLGFRSLLCGKIEYIDEPLLKYRRNHPGSLSSSSKKSYTRSEIIDKNLIWIKRLYRICRQHYADILYYCPHRDDLLKAVALRKKQLVIEAYVYKGHFFKMIYYVFSNNFGDSFTFKKKIRLILKTLYYRCHILISKTKISTLLHHKI